MTVCDSPRLVVIPSIRRVVEIGRRKPDDRLGRVTISTSSGADSSDKMNTGSAGTKQDPNRTQAMPPPVCTGTRGAALGSKHGEECGLGRDKPQGDQRSVYSSNKNI